MEREQQILNALQEGLLTVDKTGKVCFFNTFFCQMFDLSGKDVEKQNFPATLVKSIEKLLLLVEKNGTMVKEDFHIKGKGFLGQIVAVPLQEEILFIFQDKTKEISSIESEKTFLTNASHEIKTPITIIQGFAEMLQGSPKFSKKTMEEILGKIIKTSQRLSRMVQSLLKLTEVEHIEKTSFSICKAWDLLEHCKQQILLFCPHAEIFLEGSKETLIEIQVDWMELAMMNLLENAVKYSKDKIRIFLSIFQGKEEVEIVVRDEGIGIASEHVHYIFDRFYRVDKDYSRKMGGSGIGLSIVKTIVEKHGGKITVESCIGEGTTFRMFLPIVELHEKSCLENRTSL